MTSLGLKTGAARHIAVRNMWSLYFLMQLAFLIHLVRSGPSAGFPASSYHIRGSGFLDSTIETSSFISRELLHSFAFHSILSDIDGTLINSKHQVSDRTLQAITAIQNAGLPFFIATGRSRKSMADVTGPKLIDLFGGDVSKISGVFNQGLEVYGRNGELIHARYIDDDIIHKTVAFTKEHNIGLISLVGDRILCDEHSEHTDKLADYGEPLPELYSPGIVNLYSMENTRTNKLIILGEESRLVELRHKVEGLLTGQATITTAVKGMLEILPFGASKGEGVLKLLEHYDLDHKNTVAFGDGENDVEMLELVGLGIAVHNARDKLKAVAKALTLSNNDDGVAHVLEMIVSHHIENKVL